MSRARFQCAARSVLARLGEDALLRGEVVSPPRRVNVEHGVEVMQGDMHALRSVATFSKADVPRNGDTLVFVDAAGAPLPGESYIVEAAIEDNGYTVRHVVRKG